MTRWGKAGVRLTPEEIRRNDERHQREAWTRTADEQRAYQEWAAGRLVPSRITLALDMHQLEGPEVDEACGAHEPDVDRWEAGTLYPTWDQLRLLAKLTGCTERFFMFPAPDHLPLETSMRFHRVGGQRADYRQPPPVRCFTPEAIATMKETLWLKA